VSSFFFLERKRSAFLPFHFFFFFRVFFFLSFFLREDLFLCLLFRSPKILLSSSLSLFETKKPKQKTSGEGPLCYDFSKLDRYLAQPEVRKALNVDPDAPWQECNMEVNHDMLVDFMRSYSNRITPLLDGEGESKTGRARVMIYVGVEDFIW
jgi:hypothetical protein